MTTLKSQDDDGNAESDFERADMERVAIDLMGTMGEAGLTDTPRFPGVTISALAVYREIPLPATNLDTGASGA